MVTPRSDHEGPGGVERTLHVWSHLDHGLVVEEFHITT